MGATRRARGLVWGAAGLLVLMPALACRRPPAADGSGITGQLTQGPTCPGPVRPGQVCTGPLSARVDVYRVGPAPGSVPGSVPPSSVPVASAASDGNGVYRVRVSPGTYLVRVETGDGLLRCPEVQVSVPSGRLVTRDIACDTGIR